MGKDLVIAGLQNEIRESVKIQQLLLNDVIFLSKLKRLIDNIVNVFKSGNKVIFAGNGGSAADAQHLAAEFVSRFNFDRPGLPSISLATDTSILTAIGNDYGYDQLFARQLQVHAKPGDLFIGITTSGRSMNILNAFKLCADLSVMSVAFCGEGGDLGGVVDHLINVPSSHTPRIQECHTLIGHMICAAVELEIFGCLATNKNAL